MIYFTTKNLHPKLQKYIKKVDQKLQNRGKDGLLWSDHQAINAMELQKMPHPMKLSLIIFRRNASLLWTDIYVASDTKGKGNSSHFS